MPVMVSPEWSIEEMPIMVITRFPSSRIMFSFSEKIS
jgi:hypothetical protein